MSAPDAPAAIDRTRIALDHNLADRPAQTNRLAADPRHCGVFSTGIHLPQEIPAKSTPG
ncbi:hypothetical protein [Nocardia terpenica]|uniref:hypothetical protein n=1 Tax=Nocardia terpenica TaxID=455432 RepID=UPI0012FD2CC3|nr:hypothetical protein [Nocardia terpenica]